VAPWDTDLVGKVGLSPMKLFDYMACGRPIVSNSIFGVKEILEPNNAGITTDVNNPKKFAETLFYLIETPKKGQEIGQNARQTVLSSYTWEQTSRKINDLILKVI